MQISGVCFLLFVFFFHVIFLSSLNSFPLSRCLTAHFWTCLSPNKRVPYKEILKISIWQNPPEVLWLDTVRLLWNCCYPSGLLWPFCLDPDSSVFLPQTPALFPSMSCPHTTFALVILSSYTHLLHSKKHPGSSSRCSWAWEKFPVKTHRAAQALRPPRKCRFADNNYISCIYFFKLMFFTEVSAGFCCLKQGVSDFSRNFTTHCLKSNRRDGKRWAECLGWNRYFQRFSCVYINFFLKRKMFI